jgi:hypothetical protein
VRYETKVIRFPPSAALTEAQPKTWQERLLADLRYMRERVRQFFRPQRKAPVFKFKNPTHWKLERIRRKARGL